MYWNNQLQTHILWNRQIRTPLKSISILKTVCALIWVGSWCYKVNTRLLCKQQLYNKIKSFRPHSCMNTCITHHLHQITCITDHMHQIPCIADHIHQIPCITDHMHQIPFIADHMHQIPYITNYMHPNHMHHWLHTSDHMHHCPHAYQSHASLITHITDHMHHWSHALHLQKYYNLTPYITLSSITAQPISGHLLIIKLPQRWSF